MAARIGRGVTVSVGGSPVGQVMSVSVPGASCEAVKANYLDQSTAFNTYIAGMKDGGVISVEIQWVGAQYSTLLAMLGSTQDVAVTAGASTYTWADSLVTKVGEMSISVDGVMTAKFDFQAAGLAEVS